MRFSARRAASILFLLIVLASCGKSAGPVNSNVTEFGELQLNINGLPENLPADVGLMQNSASYKVVTQTTILRDLPVGSYTVSASPVIGPDTTGYAPFPEMQSVTIMVDSTAETTVDYAISTGSLKVTISGLPAGIDGVVTISGPNDFKHVLTATATLNGLTPGDYVVAADPISVKDGGYTPATSSQLETVAVAEMVDLNVAYFFLAAGPFVLDHLVESVRAAFDLPALAGAIVTLNNLNYAYGTAGTRRVNDDIAVVIEDLWHLGSNFKAFTGMLSAIAVDHAKIDWTTTISDAFPELLETMKEEYLGVTLRELLTHQSGVPRDPVPAAITGETRTEQRKAVAEWTVMQQPVSVRGTYYYTNTGYMIAGAMLDRAFGESFETSMESLIFAPLNITDAGFGPQAPAGTSHQPVSHYFEGGQWQVIENFDNPPVYSSAGGAHMSVGSWAQFLQEILRVEAGNPTIVTATSGNETTASHTLVSGNSQYGMGWFITSRNWASGRTLTHNGTNTVNHSVTWVAPLRGFAVLAVTNSYDRTESARTTEALDSLVSQLIGFYENGQ